MIAEIDTTTSPTDQSVRDEQKQRAKEQAENLKANAQQLKEDVRQQAKSTARDAQASVERLVASRSQQAATKVNEFRDAARAAAERLDEDDHSPTANTIKKAADGLDRVSGYLENTEPKDMINDASDFARRRPEIVFGGLFLAGLGLARFLKASSEPRQPQYASQYRERQLPAQKAPTPLADRTDLPHAAPDHNAIDNNLENTRPDHKSVKPLSSDEHQVHRPVQHLDTDSSGAVYTTTPGPDESATAPQANNSFSDNNEEKGAL